MRMVARYLVFLLLLGGGVGCQTIGDPGELTPESLLHAAQTSPDAVSFDIFLSRVDTNDPLFDEKLWQSVQEDRVPAEVRRALAENGLRAGVVGGTPSTQIVKLLNPSGSDPQDESDAIDSQSIGPAQVTRRLKQLRPGRRAEIQISDAPRTMRLLRRADGELTGRSYPDAQGIYGLEVATISGDQVEVQLTPELHHGRPRMKYTPSGPGMVVQRLARDAEVFADLRTTVTLSPGEMLLVTSLPKSSHRLGGLFHQTESDSGPEQKVLLVRLSQVPQTTALASADDSVWPWQ